MEDLPLTITVKYVLQNNEEHSATIQITEYSERSFALQGPEHFGKSFTDELIKINGKFNPKLKIGAGWIFGKNKVNTVRELLDKINKKEVRGVVPKIYTKTVGATGPIATEPDIVSHFNNIFTSLSNKSDMAEVYVSAERTYIWGENKAVEETVKKMGKTVFGQFNTAVKSIVMCIP